MHTWSADNETPEAATELALSIEGVKSARFSNGEPHARITGVVYDEQIGVECDVRRVGMVWKVTTSHGQFAKLGLEAALIAARSAGESENGTATVNDRWAAMDATEINHEAARVIREDKIDADLLRDLLRETVGEDEDE